MKITGGRRGFGPRRSLMLVFTTVVLGGLSGCLELQYLSDMMAGGSYGGGYGSGNVNVGYSSGSYYGYYDPYSYYGGIYDPYYCPVPIVVAPHNPVLTPPPAPQEPTYSLQAKSFRWRGEPLAPNRTVTGTTSNTPTGSPGQRPGQVKSVRYRGTPPSTPVRTPTVRTTPSRSTPAARTPARASTYHRRAER